VKRRADLRRRTGLRRTAGPRASRVDRPKADPGFQREVAGKQCAKCRRRGCQGHHVLGQQHIHDHVRSLRLDPDEAYRLEERLLSDRRNRLPLCPDCHYTHEYAPSGRLTRSYVPASAWAFARELGTWAVVRLESDYPA
jgi:hypothetical protein